MSTVSSSLEREYRRLLKSLYNERAQAWSIPMILRF